MARGHELQGLFITDGGMETTLIYHHGVELPSFASFPLLADEAGRAVLRSYYEGYLELAREQGVGLILDTATWRANRDWGELLGYSADELYEVNRQAVAFAQELRDAAPPDQPPVAVDGAVGPRGDGYVVTERMTAAEAADYHGPQLQAFADAGVDLASAYTLTYAEEAVGFVDAASQRGVPAVASFTLETDGRLPSGQALHDAIEQVDAETDGAAWYFMINCAHPTHFAHVLEEAGPTRERIRGLRANASTRSHAELDEADELDDGDPVDLAARYVELRELLPAVSVVGGCCGTDQRHVRAICSAWRAAPAT